MEHSLAEHNRKQKQQQLRDPTVVIGALQHQQSRARHVATQLPCLASPAEHWGTSAQHDGLCRESFERDVTQVPAERDVT